MNTLKNHHFRSIIIENFPSLREAGGFDFLCCSPNTKYLEPFHTSHSVYRIFVYLVGSSSEGEKNTSEDGPEFIDMQSAIALSSQEKT